MNKSDLEFFHSVGLVADVDKARKLYVKSLFLDLLAYIDELDPDGDYFELRMRLLALIRDYFDCNPSPLVVEGNTNTNEKR